MNFYLPKRRKKERMGVREPSHVVCDAHLKWVRGHECCIAGKPRHECRGRIEAHHVREGRCAGINIKHDDTAVPLCADAHSLGHTMGWQSFQRAFLVNLPMIAADLWRRSPHRIKYERKQEGKA